MAAIRTSGYTDLLVTDSAQRLPDKIAVEDPERDNAISYADFDACTGQIKG